MTIRSVGAALVFFAALAAPGLSSADIALVYDNEVAVESGRPWPASVTPGGATMPSERAMAAADTLLLGDAGGVFRASVAKLDNDLNLALIRKGEKVENDALQAAHAARWDAAVRFLGAAPAGPDVVTIAPTPGGRPFAVKINGRETGGAPVVLKKRFNKAKFRFEVVNTSTAPVWAVESKMTSSPDLSFWKEGRRQGLNDVPEKTFSHTHQAIFKPLKPGAGFVVPVEAYFIKETDYVWTVSVQSKAGSAEMKIPVRFE